MDECKPDGEGNITCPKCEHVYPSDDNCYSVPTPRGSGGCIRSCRCPKCDATCCAEHDAPGMKPF